MSTGGVFIGGGIAPKILPALSTGLFMRAFLAKPPLEAMLQRMPVKVILNRRGRTSRRRGLCCRSVKRYFCSPT